MLEMAALLTAAILAMQVEASIAASFALIQLVILEFLTMTPFTYMALIRASRVGAEAAPNRIGARAAAAFNHWPG